MYEKAARGFERGIFRFRAPVLLGLGLFTALCGWWARDLHIDAGFAKLLPQEHEYIRTFFDHGEAFGGANRILIAVKAPQGDIFTAQFLETLRLVTDEAFFIPGVDRAGVSSIFTPNVRFTEVVEDGVSGGPVLPADFRPTPEGIEQVRQNVLKSGMVGRLVANDFSAAMVSAQLLEVDPSTGKRLDYVDVAHRLEDRIRKPYDGRGGASVHIIGFAKVIGDIADGTSRVIVFFAIALGVTALLVFAYSGSLRLTPLPLLCSLVAVLWQLGIFTRLGYGMDPMGILVPFLVFAIGTSHGIQMLSSITTELCGGADGPTACRTSCRRLLVPGMTALVTDAAGFFTILLIDVPVIREMAITATIGVVSIILTNLVLLPLLASFVPVDHAYRGRLKRRRDHIAGLCRTLARCVERPIATPVLIGAAVLAVYGHARSDDVRIGDLHRGVPELRPDSRYNRDSEVIAGSFSIGVDLLSVIVETPKEGCIDHRVMSLIDDFQWHMENVEGVQSAVSLPAVAKVINAGWNEGGLPWRALPRNEKTLVQSVAYVPTSSGLLNEDCSIMPVMLFTTDHKAATIERIVSEVKRFRDEAGNPDVRFRLATGNVGVMAATNEVVAAAQFPILLWVFGVVILLVYLTFLSVRATLCIILPLGLVSLLAYAVMAHLQIGLKVSTLPVVALGVGIGVDYGIYIFSRLRELLAQGMDLERAYSETLATTGAGVLFTGLSLGISVGTWIFSPLRFQADMGILLTFLFLVNMLGAVFVLPALASWLFAGRRRAVLR